MNILSKLKSLWSSAKAWCQGLWVSLESKLSPAWQKAKAVWSFCMAHPLAKYAALALGFMLGVKFSGGFLALVGMLVKMTFDLLGLILKLL